MDIQGIVIECFLKILGMKSEKPIELVLRYLVFGLIIFIVGTIYGPQVFSSIADPNGTHKMASERIVPPSDRNADFSEIRETLVGIDSDIKKLTNYIDTKVSANSMIVKCGINNEELSDWEVSVSGRNVLALKEGDDVLIINSYTNQSQSAKFKVKFIRNDDMNPETKIYINLNGAKYFGVSNPERIGVFDLKLQR